MTEPQLNCRSRFLILLLVFMALGYSSNLHAGHILGANMSYECVGQDSFRIKLSIYNECGGVPWIVTSINVQATSTCGGSGNISLSRLQGPRSNLSWEISDHCTLDSNDCNTGSIKARQEFIYQGIAVLSPRCDSWTIGYIPPCCPTSITNLTSASAPYTELEIRNASFPCNTSPKLHYNVFPTVCNGVPNELNFGALDDDGDSLTYHLVCAKTNLSACAIYVSPYSASNPISGITLDSISGSLRFTTTISGIFIINLEIREYKKGGQYVGKSTHRINVQSRSCSANPAPWDSLGTQNIQGLVTSYPNKNEFVVCEGDSFSFDLMVWDAYGHPADSLDSLILSSNVTEALPGASFTVNAINDSVHIATVGWRAKPLIGVPFRRFNIYSSDDACPTPGRILSNFTIRLREAIRTNSSNFQLCRGDSASIEVLNSTNNTWTALPGGSGLVVGSNFSCDSCVAVKAWPNLSTTYVVQGDSNSCSTSDTIRVLVADTFSILTVTDTATCGLTDTLFSYPLSLTAGGSYSFDWSGDVYISDDTIQNPNIASDLDALIDLRIVRDGACIQEEQIKLKVFSNPKGLSAIASLDDSVCVGVPFNVSIGSACPASCGSLNVGCTGDRQTTQIGIQMGTTSSSGTAQAFPNPMALHFQSSRIALLYRASELSAAGMNSGSIQKLGFYVDSMIGSGVLSNYTIRLACTSDTSLQTWSSSTVEVFQDTNILIQKGWNTFTLDSTFYLGPNSNLLVEVCSYGNTISSSPQIAWDTTSYSSCISNYSNGGNICSQNTIRPGSQNRRPILHLDFFQEVDSLRYNVNWFPGSIFNDSLAFKTQATIGTPVTLMAIVTDTSGNCNDTLYKSISIIAQGTGTLSARADTICLGDTMTITPSLPGGTFNGNWVQGTLFYSIISGPGLKVVEYVRRYSSTCSDTARINVFVRPPANISFTIPDQCENGALYTLNASPSGGSYSGSAVIGGQINPGNLNIGAKQVDYNFTDSYGCSSTKAAVFVVLPAPTSNLNSIDPLCEDAFAFPLNGGTPAGGTYFGSGVTAGIFDPSVAGPGLNPVSYEAVGSNGCKDTSTQFVQINALPIVNINGPDTVGFGRSEYYLNPTGSKANSTFSWSVTGGSILFDNADSALIKFDTVTFATLRLEEVDSNGCENFLERRIDLVFDLSRLELNNSSPIEVLPNPTKGAVLVRTKSELITKVILRNVLGQELSSTSQVDHQHHQLTIPGAAGVYLLEVTLENGETEVFRIVKE